MQYILSLLIIFLIMWILGVDIHIILGIILGIVALVALVTILFFIVFRIKLIGARRITARFSRFGKNKWGRYDVAFYTSDDTEYENVFPCEFAFRDKLYREDQDVHILLTKKGMVYDMNAELTCKVGFAISVIVIAAGIIIASRLI
ncbi:MAG: hypothetical protein IJ080_01700 [Oscillospiraceae bacterium]|nr:hypothetical protein [Oscillospiraceae bacterium]MBQ8978457.1 hypothetical protein [Oscillospiraceae bacterium]